MATNSLYDSRPQLAVSASPPALQAADPGDPQHTSSPSVDLGGLDVCIVSDAGALASMFDSMMERTIVLPAAPGSGE